MFCKNCGQEISDNAVICPFCGVATDQFVNSNTATPSIKKVNGLGIAGFVVGLVGLFGANYLFLLPGIVGLILSIVGMVKMKQYNSCNGLAIAGLVVGIISCLFWGFIWIEVFIILSTGEYPGWMEPVTSLLSLIK